MKRASERAGASSAGSASPSWAAARRIVIAASVLVALASIAGTTAHAQLTRSVPSDEHFSAFKPFLDGNYVTAGRYFASSSRVKSTAGVWIDSICYYAMIGECKYQMGDLAGALEQYTAALQVAVTYPDWLLLVDLSRPITPSNRVVRNQPTWGVPARPVRVGVLPDHIGIRIGNTNEQNEQVLKEGGIVSQRETILINANEIVRCTALALRRRAEILGPTGEHDAMTNQLVTVLSRRLAPPNHWAQAWISLELGLALAAKGSDAQAAGELNQSLLMAGMDHPLTSTALLELGKLAFRAGNFPAAGQYFLEATYSGAFQVDEDYMQYDVMAEAFRWAAVTQMVTGKREFFAPLTPASEWARRSRATVLEAAVLLSAADSWTTVGDAARSAAVLKTVMAGMRNRECSRGELGARVQYILAHTCYLQADAKHGAPALATALAYEKTGSRRLFQISLVDRLCTSGSITSRQADLLYTNVLRDPTPLDWATDPLETLAVLSTPHVPAYEHWMMLALDRKEKDVALRISEAIRRHRFYLSLPDGGRVLNLRWTLEAPAEMLTQTAILHRQELMNLYPEYGQLLQESQKLRAELNGMPLVAENDDQHKHQLEIQTRLLQISQAQEQILWAIGLGRQRGEFVFPPTTDVTVVQQQLQPRQRVMVFVGTTGGTIAFMLGKETYSSWQVEPWTKIKPNVVELLHSFGQYDRNQPIGIKELGSSSWKDTAAKILQQLTSNAPPEAWNDFDELIIVPDGPLWYVPFEALQIQKDDEKTAVIDKVRVRYAPTVSLAVPDKAPRKRDARTAVVTGEIFSKSDENAATDVVSQLRESDPNVFGVPLKPDPPSPLLPKTVDRLVVLNDLDNEAKAPFDWAPVAAEKNKGAASLGQWMLSPWGGPDQVVLPGFHTPAEMALKRGGTGDELFLAVCGFMASGSRTVLLSRWRDGGRTSYDLMREFVRELPHRPASDAWQRSVQLARQADLDFDHEPRVKAPPADTDKTLKSEHPFFWGGYMLIDTGVEPK